MVFGMSNAKYLAFDTPNENALRILLFINAKTFSIYNM